MRILLSSTASRGGRIRLGVLIGVAIVLYAIHAPVLGAAYDICHVWQSAWTVVVAVAAVNAVVGLTVLRRRIKLVKAMLRNGRTRLIAFGLIALRAGVHLVLGAAGADVTGTAAHLVLAAGMAAATVGLLWFDQRVTFRALGLAAR